MPISRHVVLQTTPRDTPAALHGQFTEEEIKASAEKRMAEVDAMSPEWRALVHEYGLHKVRQWRRQGLTIAKARFEMLGVVEEFDL